MKGKKLISSLLVFCLLCTMSLCGVAYAEDGAAYQAGEYTAEAAGRNGSFPVSVEVTDSSIISVVIGENAETPSLGGVAVKQIPQRILEEQSTAVDAVSGATITSEAIITAVEECLVQAGAELEQIRKPVEVKEETIEDAACDIVVIGGGIAGLTAAWVASEQGRNVILVEKASVLGGNALVADGNISGAGTKIQKEAGIEDSVDQWLADTVNPDSAYTVDDPVFTRLLYEGSTEAVDILSERGVEFVFTPEYPRGHVVGPEAYASCYKMVDAIVSWGEANGVDFRKNTTAEHLIAEDGVIKGVQVVHNNASYNIYADAVILATGGYCNNKELVAKYNPEYVNVPPRVNPGATGDGIIMAEEVGAGLRAMEAGIHASSKSVVTDADICFQIIYNPCIVVNQEGNRFFAEDINYGPAGTAIAKQTGSKAYMIFDQASIDNDAILQDYLASGVFTEASSAEELAELIGTPALPDTLTAYNEMAASGVDTEFGRETYIQPITGEKLYAMEVVPYIYYSYGGVLIDTNANVLTADGDVIPGLYACGETIGSPQAWEGFVYECGLGNGLTFGRIAALSASDYVSSNS